jgi:hypothetical protein
VTIAFEQLCASVPPPAKPIEPGSFESFRVLEAQLNLVLPWDYKQLICAYGTGSWKCFLWVLSPFSANRHLNLLEQMKRQLDAERTIRAKWPEDVPFTLYPEPGGFPWAMTDNGDRLYWLTEGTSDEWPTVVFESRGPQYERHSTSCCEFLLQWMTGRLRVSVFPDDFDDGLVDAFRPLDAR